MKGFNISDIQLKNRYVQAPMAGFSDVAMRIMAAKCGASMVYTEMISASALARGSLETEEMVRETKRDLVPVALQLFGSDPEELVKAIGICESIGKYDFLDFNLGCPVNKVLKQDAGAHLLKDFNKLYSLVRALVEHSHAPVIAKARMGFSDPDDCVKIVEVLQSAGVKAIAMHGRTRNEFYTGTPHYDLLRKAREACRVTFIANGNVTSENSLEVLEQTQADALMIGRGAIGNPLVFKQLLAREEGSELPEITLEGQIALLKEQLDLEYSRNVPAEKISVEFRAAAPAFFQGLKNSRKIRTLLVHCSSKEEYLEALDKALIIGKGAEDDA